MGVALLAVVVTLALQTFRVLFPLAFRLSDDVGSTQAGLLVLGAFVVGGAVAGILLRAHRPTTIAVVGVAAARVAMQVAQPVPIWLALVTTAVAVAAVVVVLAAAIAGPPHRVVQALLVGFALDTAIRGAFRTWDPAWQGGAIPVLVALGLAVGPFLFLHALFLNSPAFVASQTTLDLPTSLTVVLVADALAILSAEAAARWRGAAFLSVGLIGVVGLRGSVGPEIMSFVALASIGTAGMLAIALRPGRPERVVALAAAGGVAMIAFFGLVLVYQLAYDRTLGFPNRFLLSASALLLLALAFSSRMRSVVAIPPKGHLIAIWPVAMLAVPGALWLGSRGDGGPPASPPSELRVATYNLHLGVRIDDGRVDLEAFARAIERIDADVLVLQEVGRGWPVNGMTDVAEWLSWRLDTPYVYAPAADGQMGNAIATRLPLAGTASGTLPQAGGLMVRSYLSVTLPLQTGEIRVVGTHLQHRDRDVGSRLAQIDVLLAALGSSGSTVLAGDMNAEPGSREIAELEAFGFTSAQDVLGTDLVTSWRDGTTIDHVFVGSGVDATSIEVVDDARASDHLPLAATVALA